jgi:hypothetical protein
MGIGRSPAEYHVGYAESRDGICWRKPAMGQQEFGGSKQNNILAEPARGSAGFFLDRAERNPARRYKAVGHIGGGKGRCICFSANGTDWKRGPPLTIRGRGVELCDIVAFLRDEQDPHAERRWKLVWQDYAPSNKPGPASVRHKYLAYGPAPQSLTAWRHNPFLSPNDGREQEVHFLSYFPCEGLWLCAFEYGFYLPNGRGVYGQYHADIRLAASRDGEHFARVGPDEPLIARGSAGAWDAGFLVVTQAPVIVGDEIWFYYSGMGEEWTCWPPGNNPRWPEHRGPASTARDEMGLAVLRRDGFVCLEVADRCSAAWVLTKPLTVTRRNVSLSVNVGEVDAGRSWVEVEVLDARNGRPLPGLSRADCDAVCSDSVRAAVTWRGRALSAVLRRGAPCRIRLRFHLYGRARLYSYGFEKKIVRL